MKTLITIIALVLITAACGSSKYTYYTPKMQQIDGYQTCPTYKNRNPVKRSHWKVLAKYKKPTQSSPVNFW